MNNNLIRLILICFILGMPFGQALPQELSQELQGLNQVNYGQLYVLEKRKGHEGQWQTGLSYLNEIDNAYQKVDGLLLSADMQFHPYLSGGMELGFNRVQDSQATNKLKAVADIQVKTNSPDFTLMPVLTFIPMAGSLVFLGNNQWPFSVPLKLGIGVNYYSQKNMGNTSLAESVMVGIGLKNEWNARYNTTLELRHYWYAPSSDQGTGLYSLLIGLGVYW
ncbi:MAG: hypothetical protein WCG27_08835 [Pseudomonadota bacterium]